MPANQKYVTLGALNVSATPHPPGVYENLLKAAQNKEVLYRGEEKAMVVSVRSEDSGFTTGQVFVYTEIIQDGAWLSTQVT
jgi:hypothetical protein